MNGTPIGWESPRSDWYQFQGPWPVFVARTDYPGNDSRQPSTYQMLWVTPEAKVCLASAHSAGASRIWARSAVPLSTLSLSYFVSAREQHDGFGDGAEYLLNAGQGIGAALLR